MNDQEREVSRQNQRICSQLVEREVLCCLSGLVHQMAQQERFFDDSGYDYYEDLMPLLEQEDWKEAFEDAGYEVIEGPDGNFYAINTREYPKNLEDFEEFEPHQDHFEEPVTQEEQYIAYLAANGKEIDEPDGFREACEVVGIDEPYRHEAYEHWAITPWFGEKLKEHGEMVGELFNLTIWGRCTTGQAISMDGVIREIASEMKILVGQENDWSRS